MLIFLPGLSGDFYMGQNIRPGPTPKRWTIEWLRLERSRMRGLGTDDKIVMFRWIIERIDTHGEQATWIVRRYW